MTRAQEPGRTGAELLIDSLVEQGVRCLFGYASSSVLPIYQALDRAPGVRVVPLRHEQAATFAASGYARASGKVGVCVVGGGPAATNQLTGILDAQLDGTPLVVISGQVHTSLIGRDAWRETDMIGMTASVTKHNFQPRSAAEIPQVIEAAFRIARTGRPGVVYIDLPLDVQEEAAGASPAHAVALTQGYRVPPAPDQALIEQVLTTILEARRPLLLVGGGAVTADAGHAIIRLAEQLHLPVATTMPAKGIVPENHPQAVGLLGSYGRRAAHWALQESDLVVALGSRLSDRLTGDVDVFAQGRRFVQVDIDPAEVGKIVPVEVGVVGDVRQVAEALLDALAARLRAASDGRGQVVPARFQPWLNQCSVAAGFCHRCVPHHAEQGVHPKRVMDFLNQRKRSDEIVCTGVGQHQAFAAHFLLQQTPRTFISSCGAGTKGFGLPAAIGAALARPSQRVILVEGDASFQANIQELATVVQEQLPLTMIVLDNHALGQDERDARGGERLVHPDFSVLASAFGIASSRASSERELENVLDEVWGQRTPHLIHVQTDPNARMAPTMPPGGTLHDYAGNCVPQAGQLFEPEERRVIDEAAWGRREDEP